MSTYTSIEGVHNNRIDQVKLIAPVTRLKDAYGSEAAAKIRKEMEASVKVTKGIANKAIIGSSKIPEKTKNIWEANLVLIESFNVDTVQGAADIISLDYAANIDLCNCKIDSEKKELKKREETLDSNIKMLQRVTEEIAKAREEISVTKRIIYDEELRLKRNYVLLEDALKRKLQDINVPPK